MADDQNPAISFAVSLWGLATGPLVAFFYGIFIAPQVEGCSIPAATIFTPHPVNASASEFPCTLIGGWTVGGAVAFALVVMVVAFLIGVIWISVENRGRAPRRA